jgi:hypothetical protein
VNPLEDCLRELKALKNNSLRTPIFFPVQFESKLFHGVKVIDYLFGHKLHTFSKTLRKKPLQITTFVLFVGVKSHTKRANNIKSENCFFIRTGASSLLMSPSFSQIFRGKCVK